MRASWAEVADVVGVADAVESEACVAVAVVPAASEDTFSEDPAATAAVAPTAERAPPLMRGAVAVAFSVAAEAPSDFSFRSLEIVPVKLRRELSNGAVRGRF